MSLDYRALEAPDYHREYLPEMRKQFYGSYHYFDFPAMLEQLEIDQSLWNNGWRIQKSMKLETPHLWYPPFADSEIRCDFHADFVGSNGTNLGYVEAGISHDCVRDMQCRVEGCKERYFSFTYNKNLCEHQIALLIWIGRFLAEANPGDATSLETLRLLNEFDGTPQTYGGSELTPLKLDLQLQMKEGELTCAFRVGEDRLYKIKKLEEFVQAVEENRELTFGSKTTLRMERSRFRGRSEEYFEFLSNWIHQQKAVDRYREKKAPMSYYATSLGDSVILYGDDLDRIFDFAQLDEITYVDENKHKHILHAREVELKPALTMEPVRDEQSRLAAVRLMGKLPKLMLGQMGAYYIEGGDLCCVDTEVYRQLKPLQRVAQNGLLDLTFGRREFGRLKYDLLPALEDSCDIEDKVDEALVELLPPELEFTFYLDAVENDVTCLATVHIDDEREYGIQNRYDIFGKPTREMNEALQERRNRKQMAKIADLLSRYFPGMDESNGQFRCNGDESTVYDFLSEGLQQLMAVGDVQSTDAFRRIRIVRKPSVTVGTRLESDLLNLEVSVEGIPDEELAAVLQQYRRRKKYYRLKNGDFIRLDSDSVQSLDEMVTAMDISLDELAQRSIEVPAYRALYIDRMFNEREDLHAQRDRGFKSVIREFRTVDEADFELPSTLNSKLRPYQETGYRWLRMMYRFGFSGILADDMGLGKTIEVISVLLAWQEEGLDRKAIIVTPASLVYNWKAEIERFAPTLRTRVINGTKSDRREQLDSLADIDVVLTSYDLLKRDIALYEDLEFDYEILDEAQYIKNAGTTVSRAVKLVRSTHRLALTGTPIENRLSELWSIFDYLMPGFLYSHGGFRRQFELPIMKHQDEEASAQLRRMVAPFILRRLKGDVLRDLPDKLEEVYYSEMAPEQQALYDAEVAHLRQTIHAQDKNEYNRNRIQILSELMRIRQICCEPGLVYENYTGESAKRETFLELLEEAIEGGHRILVFSQFTSMLEVLEKSLTERGIEYYEIIGSTPKQKRLELVNKFNQNDVPVFFISLKAGGFGLNLTGADMVIHYDPWWNVAARNQATDRAHRIGQTKVVTVYDMIVKGSIEEKIRHMQEAKQKLADDVLSGDQVASASLDREELLEILG